MTNDQPVRAGALFYSICRVTGQKVQDAECGGPRHASIAITSPFRAIHRVDPIDDAVLRANRNKAKELAKSADGDSIVMH